MPQSESPLPNPNPYEFTDHQTFGGWPARLKSEILALLIGKDLEWINQVALQVQAVLQHAAPGSDQDPDTLSALNLSSSEEWTYSFSGKHAGQIGLFAALEPGVHWEKLEPPTARWERYAVYALIHLRWCSFHLDANTRNGTVQGEHVPAETLDFQSMAFDSAGWFALEAMRAIQIAHSLRIEGGARSERARKAARAKHAGTERIKGQALEMANSRPFRTKTAAVDHITANLTYDAEQTTFVSRRAVEDWLREAGWAPEHTRTSKK